MWNKLLGEAAETKIAHELKRHLDLFQEKRGFQGFSCGKQNVGIKTHFKTAGMPSHSGVPKIMHTAIYCSAKFPVLLPHPHPGATVKRNTSP